MMPYLHPRRAHDARHPAADSIAWHDGRPTLGLLLLATLAAAAPAPPAAAASVNVFAPPTGYAVYGSAGPAMPDANWTIHQYSAAKNFYGFYPITLNGHTMYETSSGSGWVVAGAKSLSMLASGAGLACTWPGSSTVVEYDEQAVPPYASPVTPLAQLHHAILSGSLAMKVTMASGTPCPVTMTAAGDNLILDDPTYGQILFFQERLGGVAYKAGTLYNFKPSAADWYETHAPAASLQPGSWGYDDNITAHGQAYAQNGAGISYRLDLLPAMKSVIAYGAANYGMDGNLNDWIIVSRYIGSGNWGPIKDRTDWKDMALKED